VVKRVSTHELKRDLASAIAEAEKGGQVLITRHNRPVALLVSARDEHLHRGKDFGNASLQPVLKGRTKGRYLEVLQEDRYGE
jgi:prevent-host-death family protein